jgi:site-specific DNA-methyltransferase (adenine-specific)
MVNVEPIFETELGQLYNADCLDVLPQVDTETVDLVFADPPFNLGKDYGNGVNDSLKDHEYLEWCERWMAESMRVLKPGGAYFLWNLPRWNMELGHYLNEAGMMFRHWLGVELGDCEPIISRLRGEESAFVSPGRGDAAKGLSREYGPEEKLFW